ncbi:MAG: hypothetical protein HY051_05240 [Candidatus Aenigmarchaeota archaeon]|nr:hypothetical protein [Candidatus Aenigmarchaeota archaeon]
MKTKKYDRELRHEFIKKLNKLRRNARYYVFSCATKRGKCEKSGQKIFVCFDCHVNNCKQWYRFGHKDGFSRAKNKFYKA